VFLVCLDDFNPVPLSLGRRVCIGALQIGFFAVCIVSKSPGLNAESFETLRVSMMLSGFEPYAPSSSPRN